MPKKRGTEPPEPTPRLTLAELAEAGPSVTRDLPIDLIDPNPLNPRRDLVDVDALAENIRQFSTPSQSGLMQPIFVRRAGERYEVLGGHRRVAAFKLLREHEPVDPRWHTIPAVVWTADDEHAELAMISSQAHIVAWRPREQALALERLAMSGLKTSQIAERLNRTTKWVTKRIRVFGDDILAGYVLSGKLLPAVAEELLSVGDASVRGDMAGQAVTEQWGQAHTRSMVRALRLDRQLREVGRQARALLDLLSSISDVSLLPPGATDDLWKLRGRIITLGRGPVMPSIEAAERAAGVSAKLRGGGRPRKAGYRPRL